MAAASSSSGKFSSTCAVCNGTFIETPKILPCFHSFCMTCLKYLFGNLIDDDEFCCPVCKLAVKMPPGGVKSLQTDFVQDINHYLNTIHNTKKEFCNVCDFVHEKKLALYYCINCQYHLCEKDMQTHTATPSQRDHVVVGYEEMASGKHDSDIISSKIGKCKLHGSDPRMSSHPLTFCCKDCEMLICQDCVLTNHQGHALTSVEEVSENHNRKTDKLLQRSMDAREAVLDTMAQVQGDIDKLRTNKDKQAHDIVERGRRIVALIESLVEETVLKIDKIYSEEEQKSEQLLQTLMNRDECFKRMVIYVQQCMDFSDSCVFAIKNYKRLSRIADACFKSAKVPKRSAPKNTYDLEEMSKKEMAISLKEIFDEVKVHERTLQLEERRDNMYEAVEEQDINDNASSESSLVTEAQSDATELESVTAIDWKLGSEVHMKTSTPRASVDRLGRTRKFRFSLWTKWRDFGACDVTSNELGELAMVSLRYIKFLGPEGILRKKISNPENRNMWNIVSYKDDFIVSHRNPCKIVIHDRQGEVKIIKPLSDLLKNHDGAIGLAYDNINDLLYFCAAGTDTVYKCTLPLFHITPFINKELSNPWYLCVTTTGKCVVTCSGVSSVFLFNKKGALEWAYPNQTSSNKTLTGPRGVCVDDKGHIFVADYYNHRIHVLNNAGEFVQFVKLSETIRFPCALEYHSDKLIVASREPNLINIVKMEYLHF